MEFFVVIHTLKLNKSCLEIQVRSYAYQVNFVDHPASLKKITCLRNTVYLKVFTGRYSNFVGLYHRYMYCLRACTDAVMNIIHLVYLYAMYMYLYSCACKQARSMFKDMFVSLSPLSPKKFE